MEYCSNGSLKDRIHENSQKIRRREIAEWLNQICEGMAYLHSNNIIHRDLKPSKYFLHFLHCFSVRTGIKKLSTLFSILFKNDSELKICDFDLSRVWKESENKSMSFCGTFAYMAPEMMRGKGCEKVILVLLLNIVTFFLLYLERLTLK